MKKSDTGQDQSASELISKRIAELEDWRGETLSRMRKLIKKADRDVVEEWKWMGTPVWSHDGIICTGESYKNIVKVAILHTIRSYAVGILGKMDCDASP